jgi:hypothetical protein
MPDTVFSDSQAECSSATATLSDPLPSFVSPQVLLPETGTSSLFGLMHGLWPDCLILDETKPAEMEPRQACVSPLFPPQAILPLCEEAPASPLTRALTETLAWVEGFIMKPHRELGRSGSVCPFVKPSVERQALYYSMAVFDHKDPWESVYRAVRHYADMFFKIPPFDGDAALLKSIVVILPEMDVDDYASLMEPMHKRLKTDLMQENMLIGQFYPGCMVPATWNPNFYPLQSPVPTFAIRYLIESDWRFLKGNPAWESMYLDVFDGPPQKEGFQRLAGPSRERSKSPTETV